MEHVTPVNYHLTIEPDLSDFTFTATAVIRLESIRPVREIHLNVLELFVRQCRVEHGGSGRTCTHETDTDTETLRIDLPGETEGLITLAIDYRGIINDRMAGFYRSQYAADGGPRFMAVTQFQESDARRAFPCLDHPAEKATFDIEMVVDASLTALSNGDVAVEEPLGAGKKRVRFRQTPKMSTYLVFWGVGEFGIAEDRQDPRVRSVTMPGMEPYGVYGRSFGRDTLRFCEDYFGIPYPMSKLDLIAIPDFAFGAMENWGAVTFRENLLLHYPKTTSSLGEARICEVIAHEIVHQWFGNLVTPSDWKYLWLNESFATYFGYGVVDHYHPEWQTWAQFLHGQTQSALERDGLCETFPIEIPGGEHVVINSSTAPIIYSKGGSILRQVEGFIGRSDFRKGLRIYLNRHEYGCAESRHLWEALETASEKPVTEMMKSWIEQPGYPLVRVRREGGKLVFQQQRFTYLRKKYDQQWLIPLTVTIFDATGGNRKSRLILEGRTAALDIGKDAAVYKVNQDQTGFYRVAYEDAENMDRLGEMVSAKSLSAEDRWGMEHDLFALVQSGAASMYAWLDFLERYEKEDAFLPLLGIMDHLSRAHLLVAAPLKSRTGGLARRFAEAVLATCGMEPVPGESHPAAILRDQCLWNAVAFGSPEASAFAKSKFSMLVKNQPVHPDIMQSVLRTGAFFGNGETFDWFVGRLDQTEIEHDRINLLTAMGNFRHPSLIRRIQAYLLEKVPDRNRFIPVAALCRNPDAIPRMWEWYLSNLGKLEQSHPLLYERVITAIVPVCGVEKAAEAKAFFTEYSRQNPKAGDAIRLSLERLEINLRMGKDPGSEDKDVAHSIGELPH